MSNNDERDYAEESANEVEMFDWDETDDGIRYFAMRTYDTHAETWEIYPAPHMSDNPDNETITDRTGQTWLVLHNFHHTTNNAYDHISHLSGELRRAGDSGLPVPYMHFVNLDSYPTYCPVCNNHIFSPDRNHL